MDIDKIKIAKQAFYGNNENLYKHICNLKGYTMDGVFYPSNGFALDEAIATIEVMPDSELQQSAGAMGTGHRRH